jgi:PEP-CTERM motif
MKTWLWKIALAPALAAGLWLAAAGAAHATVYVGAWDPTYGSIFPDLGWRGTFEYNAPGAPNCNPNGTDSSVACIGGSSLVSASIDFYDINTNQDLATIDWATSDLDGSFYPVVNINALQFTGGQPTALATDPFPDFLPTLLSGVDGTPYNHFEFYAFSLQFLIDTVVDGNSYTGPILGWTEIDCAVCATGHSDVTQFPPQDFSITAVPEPASLALVAGALVAAGWVGRRRTLG